MRTHVPANNLELVHADILSLSSIERDDWSERITFVSAICHIIITSEVLNTFLVRAQAFAVRVYGTARGGTAYDGRRRRYESTSAFGAMHALVSRVVHVNPEHSFHRQRYSRPLCGSM